MKFSQITVVDVADYIKVDKEEKLLFTLLNAAKAYVKDYTGLSETELDSHEDLSIVVMILCSDMYDNRQMSVPSDAIKGVADSILSMHCKTS